MSRDWRDYLNTLVHCDGCGRFGVPDRSRRTGPRTPRGWKLIYQPHQGAPTTLLACGPACAERLREAMENGPVTEPLTFAPDVIMPSDVREAMFADFREYLGDAADPIVFEKLFGPVPDEQVQPAEEGGGVVLPFRRRSP